MKLNVVGSFFFILTVWDCSINR